MHTIQTLRLTYLHPNIGLRHKISIINFELAIWFVTVGTAEWHCTRMRFERVPIRSLVHYSRERDTLHTINKDSVKHGGNLVQWSEFEPTVKCRTSLRVFGENDGRKTLCGFRDMLLEKTIPLVIYSFGSNNEDSFERAILEECNAVGKTCIVSTFDPTSEPPPKSLQLETYTFFSLGLGASDGLVRVCVTDSCKEDGEFLIRPVRTLGSIMQALNHNFVDVLKIDIEGAEFESILEVVDVGGKLFVENLPSRMSRNFMEFIGRMSRTATSWSFAFSAFHQCGFRIFSRGTMVYPRGASLRSWTNLFWNVFIASTLILRVQRSMIKTQHDWTPSSK